MKKNMKKFLLVLAMLFIQNNVFADSAYSVGGVSVDPRYAYTNATQLIYDSANGYYQANINSYYNLEPTYSYLVSQTRLGGSRAFFIAAHASRSSISLSTTGSSGSDYWTGISVGEDGRVENGYKYAGLSGRDMSNTKVITFAGCYTAAPFTEDHPFNLASVAVANRAHAAVGWMFSTTNERNWLKTYNYALGAGYNVYDAVQRARLAYGGTTTANGWDIYGNRSSKITTTGVDTLATTSIDNLYNPNEQIDRSSEHLIANKVIDKEIQYVIATTDPSLLYEEIKFDDFNVPHYDSFIFNEKLTNYSSELSQLISNIKEYDASFDVNDYMFTYRIVDEKEGLGYIELVYYINDNIRTNKIYNIEFNNYKVNRVMLSSVRKSNIQNIEKLNVNKLLEKINAFEKKKINLISKEMLSYYEENSNLNEINRNNITNIFDKSIVEVNSNVTELYYYDYNDETLTYELDILRNSVNDSKYIASERIVLE